MTQQKSKVFTFFAVDRLFDIDKRCGMGCQCSCRNNIGRKQELVRNNGSESASLDPHKVESNVEFTLISDMFDGLVAVSQDGAIEPRLAASRENKDNTI